MTLALSRASANRPAIDGSSEPPELFVPLCRPPTGQNIGPKATGLRTMGKPIGDPWDKPVRTPGGTRTQQVRGPNCPGPSRPWTGTTTSTRPSTGMSVGSQRSTMSGKDQNALLEMKAQLQAELAQVDSQLDVTERALAQSRRSHKSQQ